MNNNKILPRKFYGRNTIIVGLDLLGKNLVYNIQGNLFIGKIVEVEAYLGEMDPACHAFNGKTERSKLFWQKSGIAYIFKCYGIYYCLNVITEKVGVAGCVLIRALEPIYGISLMKKNRNTDNLISLTNGPGKLTMAYGINHTLNGIDLTKGNFIINNSPEIPTIVVTSRIGISKAAEEPLRFFINNNPFVSNNNKSKIYLKGSLENIKKSFKNKSIT